MANDKKTVNRASSVRTISKKEEKPVEEPVKKSKSGTCPFMSMGIIDKKVILKQCAHAKKAHGG